MSQSFELSLVAPSSISSTLQCSSCNNKNYAPPNRIAGSGWCVCAMLHFTCRFQLQPSAANCEFEGLTQTLNADLACRLAPSSQRSPKLVSLRATLNGVSIWFSESPSSRIVQCSSAMSNPALVAPRFFFSLPNIPVLNDSGKPLNRASPRSDQTHCLAELSAPWFPSNAVVSLVSFCMKCGRFGSALGLNSGSIWGRNISSLRRCRIATRAMQVALIGALTLGDSEE